MLHLAFGIPVAKAMPRQVVKQVMAMMSSTLHAAMRRVGIPCSKPYPSLCRSSIDGTTTAGETAPRTNLHNRKSEQLGWELQTFKKVLISSETVVYPKIKPQTHGRPSIK